MSLNNSNENISALINAGADAMSNLYYVRMEGGLIDQDTSVALTVRSNNLQLPSFTHGSNTKNFMTVSAQFPKAEIQGQKVVTLSFRVDANFEVYKYLLKQQSKTSIMDYGYAANVVPDEANSNDYFTLSVYSVNRPVVDKNIETPDNDGISNEYFTQLYKFKYCWIKSINGLQFNYDSAAAQNVSVTIGFYDFEDPQNLLIK